MFARMMRRPAGFVKMALRKTFGVAGKIPTPSAEPDYWRDRFSNPGLALTPPSAFSDTDRPLPEWNGPVFGRHLLLRQHGRAASFLNAPISKPAVADRP